MFGLWRAPTNKDLAKEVRDGRFREDLFYRLNVLRLHLPPLRDRAADIDRLALFYLGRLAAEMGRKPPRFAEDAQTALRAHDWPGNVREMITRVRKALVTVEGEWIRPVDLGFARVERRKSARNADRTSSIGGNARTEASSSDGPQRLESMPAAPRPNPAPPELDKGLPTLAEAKRRLEERMIRDALRRSGLNVTMAAAELGVSRVTLYRLMLKHGMRSDDGSLASASF